MLAIKGFRIDLSTPRDRLPRRRDLRPRRHDARRPGQADRPRAQRLRPQAGRAGRPGHRARGLQGCPRRPTRRRARGGSRSRSRTTGAARTSSGWRGPTSSANPDRRRPRPDDLGPGRRGRGSGSSPTARRSRSARPPRSTSTAGPRPGTALLTWEADRILQYRLAPIAEGDNPISWPVEGPQFPNFTLTASRMVGDDRFDHRPPRRPGRARPPRHPQADQAESSGPARRSRSR